MMICKMFAKERGWKWNPSSVAAIAEKEGEQGIVHLPQYYSRSQMGRLEI